MGIYLPKDIETLQTVINKIKEHNYITLITLVLAIPGYVGTYKTIAFENHTEIEFETLEEDIEPEHSLVSRIKKYSKTGFGVGVDISSTMLSHYMVVDIPYPLFEDRKFAEELAWEVLNAFENPNYKSLRELILKTRVTSYL